MSLVSNIFLLFTALCVLCYYLVPKKAQWVILLAFSMIYYAWGGPKYILYILSSIALTYGTALAIEKSRENGKEQKHQKNLVRFGLIANFGILALVKYLDFVIGNVNALGANLPLLNLTFPLGISFYTFQSSGYLIDVYWKKTKAERNPFRYALFVSFFPQLMQGPISRFDKLYPQFFEAHPFKTENLIRGSQRVLAGLAKKMIIADWTGVFVDAVRANPEQYPGTIMIVFLLGYLQLYMDFSGAMDVVIGISEMFGIRLQENFRRPYLATSLGLFWKRWHITLGEWMMAYVFYPLSLSKAFVKLGKAARTKCGRKIGRKIPIVVADLLLFVLVGIWHGATWTCVFYGLFNGVVIGSSELLADVYRGWKEKLHIKGDEKGYVLFTILRTQFLFTIQSVFDLAGESMAKVGTLLKMAFTRFNPGELMTIPAGRQGAAFAPFAMAIILVGTVIVIALGCAQEKGIGLREKISTFPMPAKFAIYFSLLLSIGLFGCSAAAKGFIYAQF